MSTVNSPAPGAAQTPTKAIIAAVVAFLGSLVAAAAAGSPDTLQEWLAIVLTTLVAGGATYKIPNSAK